MAEYIHASGDENALVDFICLVSNQQLSEI